jgi:L-iditol 2-dehydrogenase
MKTVIIRSDRRVELIEEEIPKAKGDFAIVKVHTSPMCTEFYHYRDGTMSVCLGHEAAGEVVEVAIPGKVKVGDRVVVMPGYPCGNCDLCLSGDYIHCENMAEPFDSSAEKTGKATYSQYVIKNNWLLLPIPDVMTYDHASMACCGLGASFGAVNSLGINSSDTVMITGLGPVGLGAVINCISKGARVIGIARNQYRAKLALELGASAVLNPDSANCITQIRELTGGHGADKSIECSGGEIYQRITIDGTRRKGQVAFVGESGSLNVKVSDDLIRKGLTLNGSWHWNLNLASEIMATIAGCNEQITKMITHTFALTETEEAFKLQLTGNCGKVLLHPWD